VAVAERIHLPHRGRASQVLRLQLLTTSEPDIKTISQLVAAELRRLGDPGLRGIEHGIREASDGTLTPDIRRWDDDGDLDHMQPLADLVGEVIEPGFTLDLYINFGIPGAWQGNRDARWDGSGWSIIDPFA
jgi:hypothetical protein